MSQSRSEGAGFTTNPSTTITFALNKDVTQAGTWNFVAGGGFPDGHGQVKATTDAAGNISSVYITKTNIGGFNYSNIISIRQADFGDEGGNGAATLFLRTGIAGLKEYPIKSAVDYPGANPPCVQYILDTFGNSGTLTNGDPLTKFFFSGGS